jgi:hypothetical protein
MYQDSNTLQNLPQLGFFGSKTNHPATLKAHYLFIVCSCPMELALISRSKDIFCMLENGRRDTCMDGATDILR